MGQRALCTEIPRAPGLAAPPRTRYGLRMLLRRAAAVAALLAFAACGEESRIPRSDPSPPPGPVLSGQLVGGTGPYPGAITGVHFRSSTQSGFTDGTGTFRYVEGETVTFGVADVDFRPVTGAP